MPSPVARRYALALADEAARSGAVEAVDADLTHLHATAQASRDLGVALASPVVSREKKRRVLAALFPDLSATTTRFLDLLFDKEREGLVADVAEAYVALRDAQNGLVEARVRVPEPLSAADEDALRTSLEARTGMQVRLDVTVDPSLIGGIVVRIGDTVYDGSVRQQLARLRERLTRVDSAPSLN